MLGWSLAPWSSVRVGVGWAALLSAITLVISVLNHWLWWTAVQFALTVRGGCISLVYHKSLSMRAAERAEYSSGRLANLASVDGDNLMNFFCQPAWHACCPLLQHSSQRTAEWRADAACLLCRLLSAVCCCCWAGRSGSSVHELVAAPLLIVLCVAALLWVLGVSALVGVGALLLSLACTSWLARVQSLLQDGNMRLSDARVSQTAELLSCIKLIKLYSWQRPFADKIGAVRAEQEGVLYRSTAVGAGTRCLGLASPLLVSFASFAVFSALGNTLDATTAFTALLLFQQLKASQAQHCRAAEQPHSASDR